MVGPCYLKGRHGWSMLSKGKTWLVHAIYREDMVGPCYLKGRHGWSMLSKGKTWLVHAI